MIKSINIEFDPLQNYDKVYFFFTKTLYYECMLRNLNHIKDKVISILEVKSSDSNKSILFLVKKNKYNEIINILKDIELDMDKIENMSPDAFRIYEKFGIVEDNKEASSLMRKIKALRGE